MVRLTYSAPHDRLTRMCEAMTTAMDAHPEARDGDKAIVFLDDGKCGGIQTHGYDSIPDALSDLLSHLQSMFEAAGHTITIVPVENVGPPNLN
jgi:hypothetical protein